MKGVVEEIYVTGEGSSPMEHVGEIRAVVGGIEGDRYKEGTGYWTPYGDICEVTLIEGEDLDEIENEGLASRTANTGATSSPAAWTWRACVGAGSGSGRRFWGTIGPGHPANTSRT